MGGTLIPMLRDGGDSNKTLNKINYLINLDYSSRVLGIN